MRAYLKHRVDQHPALWVTDDGERLEYGGLRAILIRRAFAINMLRAGVDVSSLQKLLGHADLQILHHYLAQMIENITQAHRMRSPVDNSRLQY